MSCPEVSLTCFSEPFQSSSDSHADLLAHVGRKIPAVILRVRRSVLLQAGRGGRGGGHRARRSLAAVTDGFVHALPRPSLADAEPLPFLLIYLCHWPEVHKLLPRARGFLVGPCLAAGQVVPEGSFCFDFGRGLRSTAVLNISIPSQNRKLIPRVSKARTSQ